MTSRSGTDRPPTNLLTEDRGEVIAFFAAFSSVTPGMPAAQGPFALVVSPRWSSCWDYPVLPNLPESVTIEEGSRSCTKCSSAGFSNNGNSLIPFPILCMT
jgi:hypothetical protein